MKYSFDLAWDVYTQLQTELRTGSKTPAPIPGSQPRAPMTPMYLPVPTLRSLIEQIGPLAQPSAIVGACEDGLHIFLDLTDPNPGSLLIAGDRQCGKTRLVSSILTSMAMLNPHRQIRFALVSENPQELEPMVRLPHGYKSVSVYSDEAVELVIGLAEIAEQRRSGRQLGAAIVLVVENLAAFSNSMDSEVVDLLGWLVKKGPESRVWTVATLRSEDVEQVNDGLLRCFGTRLIGKVSSPDVAEYLSGGQPARLDELTEGAQFTAFFNGEWVRFWIPEPR